MDGIRALAILAVLGFHYTGFAGLFGRIPEFGWSGVDVFFTLSGFLITRILLGMRGQPSPYRTFYLRRALRIFPPYVAVQVVVIMLALLMHDRLILSFQYLLHQILFLQAFASVQAHYLVSLMTHPQPFLHPFTTTLSASRPLPVGPVGVRPALSGVSVSCWSLSVEEYFYLLWAPVVLLFPPRSVTWIGVLVCCVSVTLRLLAPPAVVSYFGLLLRGDAMMYGALLALLFYQSATMKRTVRPAYFKLLFFLSMGMLLALLFSNRPFLGRDMRASNVFSALGLPVIALAAAAVIGLLVQRTGTGWWLARLLRTKVLQFLGVISYTMYLVHIVAEWLVDQALQRLVPGFAAGSHYELVLAMLSLGLTVVLARLSWHFLEKPLLRWKDRHITTPTSPVEPALN